MSPNSYNIYGITKMDFFRKGVIFWGTQLADLARNNIIQTLHTRVRAHIVAMDTLYIKLGNLINRNLKLYK